MMRLTTREVINREASCPSSNLGQCMREALAAHPELPKLVQIRLSRVDPEEDRPPFEHFLIDTDKVEIIGRRITPYPDVDFLRKYFGRND